MKHDKTCTFGDIVEFCEDKYVFLISTVRFVYLAKILTHSETRELIKMRDQSLSRGNSNQDPPIFWFVRLTTDEFQQQVAHLANALKDGNYQYRKIDSRLNKTDLTALKKEILRKRTYDELKEHIKDITI